MKKFLRSALLNILLSLRKDSHRIWFKWDMFSKIWVEFWISPHVCWPSLLLECAWCLHWLFLSWRKLESSWTIAACWWIATQLTYIRHCIFKILLVTFLLFNWRIHYLELLKFSVHFFLLGLQIFWSICKSLQFVVCVHYIVIFQVSISVFTIVLLRVSINAFCPHLVPYLCIKFVWVQTTIYVSGFLFLFKPFVVSLNCRFLSFYCTSYPLLCHYLFELIFLLPIEVLFCHLFINLLLHDFGSGFKTQIKFSFKLFIIDIRKHIKLILRLIFSLFRDESGFTNYLLFHRTSLLRFGYSWRLAWQRSILRVSFFWVIYDYSFMTFFTMNYLILCCHRRLIPCSCCSLQVLSCSTVFICLILLSVHFLNTFIISRDFFHRLLLVLFGIFVHRYFLFCFLNLLFPFPFFNLLPKFSSFWIYNTWSLWTLSCIPWINLIYFVLIFEVLKPPAAWCSLFGLQFDRVDILCHYIVHINISHQVNVLLIKFNETGVIWIYSIHGSWCFRHDISFIFW